MISNKDTSRRQKDEEYVSYLSEILPDYQRRQRIAINNNVNPDPDEIVTNVNAEDPSAKSRIKKYFAEFANNSSIHGCNHLAARYRHPLERFLAGMIILGGLACFIYVSVVSWYRYQYDGFITLLNQQQEFMRIVKPAIIICPLNVINETKFPATFERYGIEDTPKTREFFYIISSSSFDDIAHVPDYQLPPPELWLRILNDLKIEFHYETSLSGKGLWFIIQGGLCYSIGNYIHPYATIESILADDWPVVTLPKYPPGIEDQQMENKELNDSNYLPSYVYQRNQDITEFIKLYIDARVELIDPLELYRITADYQTVRASDEFHNVVRVGMESTSQGMESTPKIRRLCRVHMDKSLTLWPIYSFEMCVSEYKANLAKKACGCYAYNIKRMPGVPVCNVTQMNCIVQNYRLVSRSPKIPEPHKVCPFNCNYIYFLNRGFKLNNTNLKNYSYMEIRMIFPSYRYVTRERFSFIDLMTAVGSAAGLFLGCSVLSAVEIFYYSTLRLYINMKKHK